MKYFLVPQPNGDPIELTRAVTLVGRQRDCDLPIVDSERISRRHCCVVQVDEEYHVRDLGSTNGVRVNKKRVEKS
ncbi:MAG: FHA domain-containing protein, partial [Planctomycetota bacterium]